MPKDDGGLRIKGEILLIQGDNAGARDVLQQAVTAQPDSPAGRYLLGQAQERLGNLGQATTSFQRALQLQPGLTDAGAELAGIELKQMHYDGSLRYAADLIRSNPNAEIGYLVRANAELAKGDAKDGEAALQQALRLDPSSPAALTSLVDLYAKQNRVDKTMPILADRIQKDPSNGQLYYLQAKVYALQKNLPAAEASVTKAIQYDPKNVQSYALLSQIHMVHGQPDQARLDLEASIAARPTSLANYMLGAVYEKQGDWKQAQKYFERAHVLDATAPSTSVQLARLYLQHGGDMNLALSLAQSAKQQAPDEAEVREVLGWAYYKLGVYPSAASELEYCARKNPSNVACQYHLGMTYVALGDSYRAKESLQKALSLDASSVDAPTARATLSQITSNAKQSVKASVRSS
jgi:cellulose synthase operon protein C